MIGTEDFIAMKVSAGGMKDLEDVRAALEVSAGKVGLAPAKKLARLYGVQEARTLAAILKEKGILP